MSTSETAKNVVKVEIEGGIAWVTFNRPAKRNAISPTVNRRMIEILEELEGDDACSVLVLTGAGDSWSAGMDLKEYFKENDDKPRAQTLKVRREAQEWWARLRYFDKPTIAMVNGWCFGGAFMPLICCDLAVAAEDAKFGLSEINWGILPGGNVTRALAEVISYRDALYYIMTGELFDGKKAQEMRLVNEAVPADKLKERVRALCATLQAKNAVTLKAAKDTFKRVRSMPWDDSNDYIYAKFEQMRYLDPSHGRDKGLKQFLEDKTYRPGLSAYDKNK